MRVTQRFICSITALFVGLGLVHGFESAVQLEGQKAYSFEYVLPASRPFIVNITWDQEGGGTYGKKRDGEEVRKKIPLPDRITMTGMLRLIFDERDSEGNYPVHLTWLGGHTAGSLPSDKNRLIDFKSKIKGWKNREGSLSPSGEWIWIEKPSRKKTRFTLKDMFVERTLTLLWVPETPLGVGQTADCTERWIQFLYAGYPLPSTGEDSTDFEDECLVTLTKVEKGMAHLTFRATSYRRSRLTTSRGIFDHELDGSARFDLEKRRISESRFRLAIRIKVEYKTSKQAKKSWVSDIPNSRHVYQISLHEE